MRLQLGSAREVFLAEVARELRRRLREVYAMHDTVVVLERHLVPVRPTAQVTHRPTLRASRHVAST